MKKHPLFGLVEEYLQDPSQEITIHPANSNHQIPITVVTNLPSSESQHDTVIVQQNLTLVITYRAGKKTGMKSTIKRFIPLSNGNNTSVPLTGQSVTTSVANDIAL
jgi:hypothetical protein